MSATKVRKLRRQQQRVIATAPEQIADAYNEDPNKALVLGYEIFGRENFEKAVRVYLHQHWAKVAFMLAARRCIAKQGGNNAENRA